jgi:small acid-soluble spore protein H (minor)
VHIPFILRSYCNEFEAEEVIAMDVNRATEIAASPIMADVSYNGIPVYIQHVDEEKGTARIYSLAEPDQEIEVPVRSLAEPSSMMAMEVDQVACRVSDGGVEK